MAPAIPIEDVTLAAAVAEHRPQVRRGLAPGEEAAGAAAARRRPIRPVPGRPSRRLGNLPVIAVGHRQLTSTTGRNVDCHTLAPAKVELARLRRAGHSRSPARSRGGSHERGSADTCRRAGGRPPSWLDVGRSRDGRVHRHVLGLGAAVAARAPPCASSSSLTAFQQSLLVAVPVIVGSLGRIPVGALTDRLGARVMFPDRQRADDLAGAIPRPLGRLVTALFLIGGFFLGLGGTTFAIGIPFVNAWYPPARRGLGPRRLRHGHGRHRDLGVTPCNWPTPIGRSFPFNLVAVVLAVYAGVSLSAAARQTRTGPWRPGRCSPELRRRCGCRRRWQLSFLYAVAFGGFVAFSVYLPTYLTTAYGLERSPTRRCGRRASWCSL